MLTALLILGSLILLALITVAQLLSRILQQLQAMQRPLDRLAPWQAPPLHPAE